ncbi:GNAT family N-acetyltransferase [Microtetraspora malaysiensis]|uniref:GNAT family N-acetyltransferase n=1 Tax=Microtetraspora malaysiensis TaxID=161358 RepID=UPI003D8D5B8A
MRKAQAADVAAVRRLVLDAYRPWAEIIGRPPMPMEADYEALVAEGRVHVRDAPDGIEGLIVLIPEDGVLLVDNVAVRPDRQGRGVGRSLLAFAEEEARRLGLPALRLITNVKMTPNIALYASLGYMETGRGELNGRFVVRMRKELAG